MSRIGKLPIEITKGVKLDYNDSVLTVKGPNGTLTRQIMSCVTLDITDTSVTVTRNDEINTTRAAHGLTRTLINNMVVGVTKGFQTNLEINGVGYRAEVKGTDLVLSLGYSHPVNFQIPAGITIEVEKMTKMSVKGFDKELVGQTAAKIKVGFDGTEPTLVWKNPQINPHVGGMVLIGNYIYSSTHDTNSKGRWICVDWTTGKTMWITDWNNKGSVISADGLLYIYEEKNGNIALVNPNSEKLDIISSFRVTKGDGPYWSHPVIDKGRLYVRHGDYLAVYSIKAK